MSKVVIITDSTAGIPQNIVDDLNIIVVPLFVIWDGEELKDGIDISPLQFYQRLESSDTLPTSSQPLPADFKAIFKTQIDAGNDVLAVLVSHKLSGTYASALEASKEFDPKRIRIFDTLNVSMGTGVQVMAAARAALNGEDIETCLKAAEKSHENAELFFVVKTLKYLHMGGRIGNAANLLGTAFSLKPLLKIEDGAVASVDKVRTRKKSIQKLIDTAVSKLKGKENVRLIVLHADDKEMGEDVLNQLQEKLSPEEAILTIFSAAIGVHSGQGAVGIAYSYD